MPQRQREPLPRSRRYSPSRRVKEEEWRGRRGRREEQLVGGGHVPRWLAQLGKGLIALAVVSGAALGFYSRQVPASQQVPVAPPLLSDQAVPLGQNSPGSSIGPSGDPSLSANPLVGSDPGPQVNPGPSANSLPSTDLGPSVDPSVGGGGPSPAQPPVKVSVEAKPAVGEAVPFTADNVTAVELGTVIPCQQTFCPERWQPLLATLSQKVVTGKIQIFNPLANALETVGPVQFQALMGSEAGPFIVSNNALNYCGQLDVPDEVFKLLYGPYVFNTWIALTPAQQDLSLIPEGKVPLAIAVSDLNAPVPVKTAAQGFADREKLYPVSIDIDSLSLRQMIDKGYIWIELPVGVMAFEASGDLKYWPQAFRIVFPSTVGVRVDYFTPLYHRNEGFDWPAKPVPGIGAVPQGRINIAVDEPTWTQGTRTQDPLQFKLTLTGPQGDVETITFNVWARLPRER